jgi:hypothetical protein
VPLLNEKQLEVKEEISWAPLPSVTATGKYAVSPVKNRIKGLDTNEDFEPSIIDEEQAKAGTQFKKLLEEEGWIFLSLQDQDLAEPQGKAWCEYKRIDQEGHHYGVDKFAESLDKFILDIRDHINKLIRAGWKRVIVVTDHGFLLLPRGLPKLELPNSLTDTKWCRSAYLKPGLTSPYRHFPWYWNPAVSIVLADGVSCFKKGEEYTHGGLSLQECLTLRLTVTLSSLPEKSIVKIKSASWQRLRLTVTLTAPCEDLFMDVREISEDQEPENFSTCLQAGKQPFNRNGTVSVLMKDFNLEGKKAEIIIIDSQGTILAEKEIVIGDDTYGKG